MGRIGLVAPLRFKWLDSQPDSSMLGPVPTDFHEFFDVQKSCDAFLTRYLSCFCDAFLTRYLSSSDRSHDETSQIGEALQLLHFQGTLRLMAKFSGQLGRLGFGFVWSILNFTCSFGGREGSHWIRSTWEI